MKFVTSFLVSLFFFKIKCSFCEESAWDKTTQVLYNLTNYAIESRRIRNPCFYEQDESSYFACMNKLTSSHTQMVQTPNYVSNLNYYYPKPQKYIAYPHKYVPYPQPPLANPYQASNSPQSVMDVLYTISQNDALRCVPRLLCEVTSDTISSRQNFKLPSLPLNLDMKSIIRLLATFDFPGSSPIPYFAKAALLGYVSKGNSDSCLDAYPTCPRDPNKLVQYLNNYNGGFFRYFNGVNRKPSNYQYGLINYPQYGNVAQKRIQNRPVHHLNANDVGFDTNGNFKRKPKTLLAFPTEDDNHFNAFAFKKPKELPFSINEYYVNELDLQKPLPNHKATPIIFPVRTGTGDLRLDADELDANYNKYYKLQNNNFVSFKPTLGEGFYYQEPEGISTGGYNSNKAVFTFPL